MSRYEERWWRSPRGVVLDGGTGTLLEDAGIDVAQALWGSVALLTEEGRSLTRDLHRRYVAAGAELVIANTHNASLEHARRFLADLEDQSRPHRSPPERAAAAYSSAEALMRALNRSGIEVARAAVLGTEARVAGCLASPDVPYAREASMSPDEVADALAPQLEVIAEAAPDLILFEMCTTASDVAGISRLAEGLNLPFGVGLVCGEDGRLLAGMEVAAAVRALAPARPALVFVQCTPWDRIDGPLEELVRSVPADVGVGVYANDGRGWSDRGWVGARVTPEIYAEAAGGWWHRGARVIGGCCGTTPAHIEAVAARLSVHRHDRSPSGE